MPDTKPMIRKIKPSDVEFAWIGWRILAWFIDILIISAITHLIYLFLVIPVFKAINLGLVFLFGFDVFWNILAYIVGFFYFWLLETFNNGQTLGKLIVGLKTVDEDTFEVSSFTENLKNCILKCHWFPCIIDLIIGIFKNYEDLKRKLRIMQNASHTVVIKIR